MLIRLQFRYDTTADWNADDPVLAAGEPGFDIDVGAIKVGDGATPWSGLEYQTTDPAALNALLLDVQAAQAAAEAAQAAAEAAAAGATGATDAGVAALVNDTTPPNLTRAALNALYATLSHVHTASQVTDFNAAVETALAALLDAGTNVTILHTAGSFLVSSTGGGTGLDSEAMMDFLGGVTAPGTQGIKGTGLVTVTYNDAAAGGAGTITITTTATQNQTDAFLLARANHTGEVPLNTIASDVSDTAATDLQLMRWIAATGKWTPFTLDLTPFATKTTTGGGVNGRLGQFADVPDAQPAADEALVGDGTGAFALINLSGEFAQADPTTNKLLNTEMPKYGMFGIIIDEGDPVPTDLPVGLGYPIVGFSRPAAPSLIPVMEGGDFALAANNNVVTNGEAYAVGDDLVLVVGASGEAVVPAVFKLTLATGVAAVTLHPSALQSGSAQTEIYHGKVTTAIPAGTNFTVNAYQTDGTTAQNRAQFHVVILKLPNLAVSSPFDKQATQVGGSSSVLDLVVGPTTALAQPSEVGIMALVFNSGTGATVRTIAPTNGWSQLYNAEAEAAAARTLLVAYKVFDAGGTVSGNAHITASDGASGGWAGALATFKSL